ncbi:hypothetical protein SNE40_011666 [Patella caerulea]|uniref:Uncharacterized protein n=1 Tax=Patella caerulea TaxID=87958 RepID=A0AAN8PPL6_PATCE
MLKIDTRELNPVMNSWTSTLVIRITFMSVWLMDSSQDPNTKQESMKWKHKNSPVPKKFRTQPSPGKIMATIFWDSRGVIVIDYKPPKTPITGAY